MGLMATMLPGVRPSISFASLPTASTSPVFLLMATMEGSFTTMPLPRAYTRVLAVPRSMARSLEKMLNSDRRLCARDPLEYPLFDMTKFFLRPSNLLSGSSSRNLRMISCGLLGFFLFYGMPVNPALLQVSKLPLLDNDLLLLRIHSALRRLCRHRDHCFSRRQR